MIFDSDDTVKICQLEGGGLHIYDVCTLGDHNPTAYGSGIYSSHDIFFQRKFKRGHSFKFIGRGFVYSINRVRQQGNLVGSFYVRS
jgi:hypothetical protein